MFSFSYFLLTFEYLNNRLISSDGAKDTETFIFRTKHYNSISCKGGKIGNQEKIALRVQM